MFSIANEAINIEAIALYAARDKPSTLNGVSLQGTNLSFDLRSLRKSSPKEDDCMLQVWGPSQKFHSIPACQIAKTAFA